MSYDEVAFPTRIILLLNMKGQDMATHSPQDLDLLLSKLSGDDSFRQSFLSDPQLALGGLGIKLDASSIPAARSLPSKELIAASRHAIKGKLENAAGAIPFFLSGQR